MKTSSDRTSLERAPGAPEGSSPESVAIEEPPTVQGEGSAPPPTAEHVTPTRISASWTAVVAAVVLLILLVIFIAENTQRSTVNFVGFHGHAPTAVVLLISVIAGAVIVVIVGAARILQLRKVARHSESLHQGRS
jgi:uncharacterized integral membrane protein